MKGSYLLAELRKTGYENFNFPQVLLFYPPKYKHFPPFFYLKPLVFTEPRSNNTTGPNLRALMCVLEKTKFSPMKIN